MQSQIPLPLQVVITPLHSAKSSIIKLTTAVLKVCALGTQLFHELNQDVPLKSDYVLSICRIKKLRYKIESLQLSVSFYNFTEPFGPPKKNHVIQLNMSIFQGVLQIVVWVSGCSDNGTSLRMNHILHPFITALKHFKHFLNLP